MSANFTALLSGATKEELWARLVQEGETITGNVLSEDAKAHLIHAFIRFMEDSTDLTDKPIVYLYTEAQEKHGTLKTNALQKVGDICLMRAGFLPLVSKHFKRVAGGSTTPYYISFGRTSYQSVSLTHEVSNRKRTGRVFRTLIQEFVMLVEILWAIQQEGYPELMELIEVSSIEGARHTKIKIKELTKGVILDAGYA